MFAIDITAMNRVMFFRESPSSCACERGDGVDLHRMQQTGPVPRMSRIRHRKKRLSSPVVTDPTSRLEEVVGRSDRSEFADGSGTLVDLSTDPAIAGRRHGSIVMTWGTAWRPRRTDECPNEVW